MPKVYREVGITVGMGEYPTNFTTAVIDVMTENDIVELLVDFPPRYDSYRKIVDIGYVTASQVYTVETYEMSYSDDLEKYFFFMGRKFAYGEKLYLQFRCLYEDGQESVDAAILRLKFRPALRTADFESYENNDLETQSEILEKLVIQHANVNASSRHTGHVMVDDDTISINENGTISARPQMIDTSTEITILRANEDSDFYTIKTGVDAADKIRGVCNIGTMANILYTEDGPKVISWGRDKVFYFHENILTNQKKIKVFPESVSSEEITADSGANIQFNLSGISSDNLLNAKLCVPIKDISLEYNVLYPKEAELHRLGYSDYPLDVNKEAMIDSLKTANPDSPTYTDGYYHESGIAGVRVWNSGGELEVRRTYVYFDLTLLPTPFIVESANLKIRSLSYNINEPQLVGIHHANSFWDAEATYWGDQPSFDEVPIAQFVESDEIVNWINIDLTSEVSAAVNSLDDYHGWCIKYATESLPETLDYGHYLEGVEMILEVKGVTGSSALVDPIVLGTFAITGSQIKKVVDVTEEVIQWLDTPGLNEGFYLAAVTATDTHPFYIYQAAVELINLSDVMAGVYSDYGAQSPYLLLLYSGTEVDDWESDTIFYPTLDYPMFTDIAIGSEINIPVIGKDYNACSGTETSIPATGCLNIRLGSDTEDIEIVNRVTSIADISYDPKIVTTEDGRSYIFCKQRNDSGDAVIKVFSDIMGTESIIEHEFSISPDNTQYYTVYNNTDFLPPPTWGIDVGSFGPADIGGGATETQMLRGFMQFDLSSLPPIGEDAIILSATLVLDCINANPSGTDIGIYHVNDAWYYYGFSWDNQPSVELTPFNTFSDTGSGGTISIDISTEISNIGSGAKVNNGWMLKYINEGGGIWGYNDYYTSSTYSAARLNIRYATISRAKNDWIEIYTSSAVMPNSYSYTVPETFRYMGGEAVSNGNDIYFVYISHQEITNEKGTYLEFAIHVLKREEDSWTDSIVYTYSPMFPQFSIYESYLYTGVGGYPFNIVIFPTPEIFDIKLAVKSRTDISVLAPFIQRGGIPSLLLVTFDGSGWEATDIRVLDWDRDIKIGDSLVSIRPGSIIYTSDGIRISYHAYTLPGGPVVITITVPPKSRLLRISELPTKYAKNEGRGWIGISEIATTAIDNLLWSGYNQTNILQKASGEIIIVKREANEDAIKVYTSLYGVTGGTSPWPDIEKGTAKLVKKVI